MRFIVDFFKAISIAILLGIFSSIALIGFNFSTDPIYGFKKIFWPTAIFCSLLGFFGTYAVIYFRKLDKKGNSDKKYATHRGLFLALSIIMFTMTAKGIYEYVTSPYRASAQIKGVRLDKNIKRKDTCPGGSCAIRYESTLPRHSKFW